MTSEQPPTASTPTADATDADATAEAPAATTAPSPPPGAPVTTTTGGGFRIGPGQAIAAVGAIAVGVACFLDWVRARGGVPGLGAKGVSWDFLWDKRSTSGTSLLVWLIPIAVLILVAAVVPQLRFVGLVGGIAALAVAGLYAFQLNAVIDDLSGDVGSVYDRLGIGDYLVAGGGFLAIVGTLVPRPSRTST